ncbi:MAG TPA: histidine kinase [Ideonella sp.]|uniref:sensor histidine kinase n=1 Tax=Ideonella sp. TaxID=1929293 RepID=UPI002E2FF0D4|nr:histidine kinase [Ideonella sp.]HEX5686516.1 histidine kinase [Ideonella sp.]
MKLTRELLKQSWRSWISNDMQRVGPYWLTLCWTGLFAIAVGFLFTFAGFAMYSRSLADWMNWASWRHWLGLNLFISFFSAYAVHGMFELLLFAISRKRIRSWGPWGRGVFFSAVPLVGVLIAWPLAVRLAGHTFSVGNYTSSTSWSAGMLLFVLMFSMLLNIYYNANARTQAAERRAAEAQLRLLQGQIEPHFLFNTLANVVGLIDADPARARQMLESFIDYLRASLGGLRNQAHTLGQEIALIDAYLRVLALRMEDRLRVRLEVPPELFAVHLPALLVQPLVENAIHHGIEPKVEGGEVQVRAELHGDRLRIDVIDDGLGLDASSQPGRRGGAGAALANIRERLRAAFGDEAQLTLDNRPEGGVRATLLLPWPPH